MTELLGAYADRARSDRLKGFRRDEILDRLTAEQPAKLHALLVEQLGPAVDEIIRTTKLPHGRPRIHPEVAAYRLAAAERAAGSSSSTAMAKHLRLANGATGHRLLPADEAWHGGVADWDDLTRIEDQGAAWIENRAAYVRRLRRRAREK
jgi:hypothetical protein